MSRIWDDQAVRLNARMTDGLRAGWAVLTIIAVEDSTESAQDRTFFTTATTRRRGNDAAGEAREGEGLQPDLARTAQRREEQAFATEERRFHSADELDVVVDARLEADDTARINAKGLVWGQCALEERAAGVDECPAVAVETLHDETLAAEQAGTE